MLCAKMLKEIETEKTTGFFVTLLSLVAFQLGGPGPQPPLGYAYALSFFCSISYLDYFSLETPTHLSYQLKVPTWQRSE